jgi:pilus assembly protein CpaE
LPETRVLLLGDSSSDAVARVLAQHERFLTRVDDPDEAIRVAPEHEIVVVDTVAPPRTVASVCRDIRAIPGLASIPILAISASEHVEDRIRLLEAGADDVMARPIDERELDARIEALDLRFRRSKDLRPATVVSSTRREGRRLIVVFSPKGGAGTTTIALNLALAIDAQQSGQVVVADLAAGAASVATHLNARPRLGITDMLRDHLSIGDPEAIRQYLTTAGRLLILAGTPGPGTPLLLDKENIGPVLDTVLSAVPTVVVDAGSALDDRTIGAMELADNLVLVVTPEFPGLKSVHAVLEYLHEIGSSIVEPTIVLNELFERQMLTSADVESALGKRVAARIPHDPVLFQRAANEGSPIYALAGSSPQAHRFDELAAVLVGDDAPMADAAPRRRGLGGLFGRG